MGFKLDGGGLLGRSDTKGRMVYIKNTLSLETIMVSEALLEQVRARDDMEIMEEPRELRFDESGALLDFA